MLESVIQNKGSLLILASPSQPPLIFEKVISIAESENVSSEILLEAHYFLIECYKNEKNGDKVLFHFDKSILLSAKNQQLQQQMIAAKQKYIEKN